MCYQRSHRGGYNALLLFGRLLCVCVNISNLLKSPVLPYSSTYKDYDCEHSGVLTQALLKATATLTVQVIPSYPQPL